MPATTVSLCSFGTSGLLITESFAEPFTRLNNSSSIIEFLKLKIALNAFKWQFYVLTKVRGKGCLPLIFFATNARIQHKRSSVKKSICAFVAKRLIAVKSASLHFLQIATHL